MIRIEGDVWFLYVVFMKRDNQKGWFVRVLNFGVLFFDYLSNFRINLRVFEVVRVVLSEVRNVNFFFFIKKISREGQFVNSEVCIFEIVLNILLVLIIML